MLKVRQIKVSMLGCVTLLWSLSLCTGFQHLHQSTFFFLPSRSSGHVGERDHHCLCINGLLGIFLRTQGAQIAEAIKNLRSNVYSQSILGSTSKSIGTDEWLVVLESDEHHQYVVMIRLQSFLFHSSATFMLVHLVPYPACLKEKSNTIEIHVNRI